MFIVLRLDALPVCVCVLLVVGLVSAHASRFGDPLLLIQGSWFADCDRWKHVSSRRETGGKVDGDRPSPWPTSSSSSSPPSSSYNRT